MPRSEIGSTPSPNITPYEPPSASKAAAQASGQAGQPLTAKDKMAVRKLAHDAGVPRKTAHAAIFTPALLGDVARGTKLKHFSQDLDKLATHLEKLVEAKTTLPGALRQPSEVLAGVQAEQGRRDKSEDLTGDSKNRHHVDGAKRFDFLHGLPVATKINRSLRAISRPLRESISYKSLQVRHAVVDTAVGALQVTQRATDQAMHSLRKGADDGFNLRRGKTTRHTEENGLYAYATRAQSSGPLTPELSRAERDAVKTWVKTALNQGRLDLDGRPLTPKTPWSKARPVLNKIAEEQRSELTGQTSASAPQGSARAASTSSKTQAASQQEEASRLRSALPHFAGQMLSELDHVPREPSVGAQLHAERTRSEGDALAVLIHGQLAPIADLARAIANMDPKESANRPKIEAAVAQLSARVSRSLVDIAQSKEAAVKRIAEPEVQAAEEEAKSPADSGVWRLLSSLFGKG